MNSQLFNPQEVQPHPNQINNNNNSNSITSFKPILQPILNKKDGKYYTFLDYGDRVCLHLQIQDKQQQTILNNEGKPKTFYKYFLKSQLKQQLIIGESPFQDPLLSFTFYTKFDRPQFNGHRPNVAGWYSDWILVRDKSWAVNNA